MARRDLTDAEWSIIVALLPGAEGRKNGRPRPVEHQLDNVKSDHGIVVGMRTDPEPQEAFINPESQRAIARTNAN